MPYNDATGRALNAAALEAGAAYNAVHKAHTLLVRELLGTPAYAIACAEEQRLREAWTAATDAASAYFEQCNADFSAQYEAQRVGLGKLQAA